MTGWKSQIRQNGVVSARSLAKAAEDRKFQEDASPKDEKNKKEADICLNCKKPVCKGSDGCFKKLNKNKEK